MHACGWDIAMSIFILFGGVDFYNLIHRHKWYFILNIIDL